MCVWGAVHITDTIYVTQKGIAQTSALVENFFYDGEGRPSLSRKVK